MALILKEYEVCPYAARCKHNNNGSVECQGGNAGRKFEFCCEFVNNGLIKDGFRNPFDYTGKMQIILD